MHIGVVRIGTEWLQEEAGSVIARLPHQVPDTAWLVWTLGQCLGSWGPGKAQYYIRSQCQVNSWRGRNELALTLNGIIPQRQKEEQNCTSPVAALQFNSVLWGRYRRGAGLVTI